VVTGEEVDAVRLTKQMKKKFRCAKLIRVENMEEAGEEGGQEEEDETITEKIYPSSYPICSSTSIIPSFIIYDYTYPNNCSIL